MLTIEKLLGAVLMFLICAAIPFLWWKIRHKKGEGFFTYLGIKKPKLEKNLLFLIGFGVVYLISYIFDSRVLINADSIESVGNSANVASNVYRGLGILAILPALIESFMMNGLSEELFFRGFINKRLCARLGIKKGLLVQAILFGLLHNVLSLIVGIDMSIVMHIAIFASTVIGALMLGFLNERIFNGSIFPSIFLHGLGNFFVMINLAFS